MSTQCERNCTAGMQRSKFVLHNTAQVNGKMITSLGTRVDARKDDILVDGKRVSLRSKQETVWVAIHKPKVSIHFYMYILIILYTFIY
jgi:16S rRNA U516 pseudouridylate synthase RsuA-like enzyme